MGSSDRCGLPGDHDRSHQTGGDHAQTNCPACGGVLRAARTGRRRARGGRRRPAAAAAVGGAALQPRARVARPASRARWRRSADVNADYVTAASTGVRGRRPRPRRRPDELSARKVGGVWCAGRARTSRAPSSATACRAPDGGRGTLRIEEAGAEDSRYDVLVDGVRVHAPRRQPGAARHLRRPGRARALRRRRCPSARAAPHTFTLTFRNAARARPGRAHRRRLGPVAPAGDPQAPYGGTVENAAALTRRRGSAELRADLFGRPYVDLDFGREVGGTVSVTRQAPGTAPRGSRSPSASPSSS